jgi:GPH family glycoside/pentoside/hexuronide:cation symporter
VLGSLIQIVGILVSKALADWMGKKTLFIAGITITTLATAAVYFVSPTDLNLMFALSVIWAVGWGPTVPLLWIMIADVADYSEWKTSRRATAFMYAGILFALKAGLGLGGALSGWIMDGYGYVANAVQSPSTLHGIRLCASIYSALPFAIGIVCLALYPIGRELNQRIQVDLEERRKSVPAARA